MSPKEFFIHVRAGRTSLCDTVLTTSQTVYSQRKLIKLMENMVAHNDRSVRCVCSRRIYEESFGRDGIDPCKRVLDPNLLKKAIYKAICTQAENCPPQGLAVMLKKYVRPLRIMEQTGLRWKKETERLWG